MNNPGRQVASFEYILYGDVKGLTHADQCGSCLMSQNFEVVPR